MEIKLQNNSEVDNKPYIIISCGYTRGVEKWLQSYMEHLKLQTKVVVVMFRPYFDVPQEFIVIKQEKKCDYELERFIPLQQILLSLGFERWYIWTDYCDVFFQSPLPSLGSPKGSVKAYVYALDIIHRDMPFWRPFLSQQGFKILEDLPVFDIGCFAIQGRFFLDFINYLLIYKTFLRQHPLPIEQLFFNKWLYFNSRHISQHNTLLVSTGTPLKSSTQNTKKPRSFIKDNLIVNSQGIPYCIVHTPNGNRELPLWEST